MKTETIDYFDQRIPLEGYYAYKKHTTTKRPLVLVVHDFSGLNEFACNKAKELAELGYVGFALDMYGKGVIGSTNAEKSQLMKPFMDNRQLLRQRVLAGFHTAAQLPMVDPQRIAAIGFCFGGLCVLDLARSGVDLRGAVSFHGFFNPPVSVPNKKINAKILAFYGADDPMVPMQQIIDFKEEMATEKVDWQVHIYGNTMHGFTNPKANDPKFGVMYNPLAAKRSWLSMQNFLTEIFA